MMELDWLSSIVSPSPSPPEDSISVNNITLFVGVLCSSIIIGHLAEPFRWINHSIVALTFGLCSGFFILLTSCGKSPHLLEFNEEIFFIYLLPPIIFNAGFQMRKKQFFRNFVTISLYGVVGTLISFGVISFGAKMMFKELNIDFMETSDYLAIGAIFSATDSVCTLQVLNQESAPFLYSLVFGEGVVNDATSVVLFNAILEIDPSKINSATVFHILCKFVFLFTGSTLLGVSVGLLCAYIVRKLYFCRHSNDRSRHSTDHEVALMILMAYLSYMMAEVFNLSGILTVFFCGIVMSHYTWYNVTSGSRTTAKHGFATMSFIAETFIFIYVGTDVLEKKKWTSNSPGNIINASTTLVVLVLVGRAMSVLSISCLSNFFRTSVNDKINLKQQVTIWWAGLMRGAVSMALAYNKFTNSSAQQSGNTIMVTSTITVVLFSTMVFGLLTKPLMRLLMPKNSEGASDGLTLPLLDEDHGYKNLGHIDSLRMLITSPTSTVHYYWSKFDNALMRPIFGGPGLAPHECELNYSPFESVGGSSDSPRESVGGSSDSPTENVGRSSDLLT